MPAGGEQADVSGLKKQVAATAAALAIDGDTLRLSGTLDADSVLALHQPGCDWLVAVAPTSCRVDLGAVEFSSSAGVALLLDWLRAATTAGKQLTFTQLPAQMGSIIGVSGLETLFTPGARH